MSLMSSIFGGAPATADSKGKKKDSAPDLFGAKLTVPTIVQKKSLSSAKKAKKEDPKADDKLKDESSSNSDEVKSSASDPAVEQNAKAEDEAETKSTNKNAKKTKEELKEEEDRTIFVGNLPPDISRRALAGIFKSCGKVLSARFRSMAVAGVKLPPDQAGNQNMMRKVCANTGKFDTEAPKKSIQGYVVFKSVDSIPEALKLNNTNYETHTIRVDSANPTLKPSLSVFVGNLPYGAQEETLREHFLTQLSEEADLNESEGSAVSGVRIIRDKETQKCKGFGYVMLRDATLVPLALQLHGTKYMKRELRVNVAGKRFKGNRGDVSNNNQSGKRSFEGHRASGEASSQSQSKRKSADDGPKDGRNEGAALRVKKRRARSEKKTTQGASANRSGMSKRAVTEKKVNKRVKKLQKRVTKGMGKKNA